ncbi:MAG: hypothetical protein NWR72_05595 [Bacteroidia bacterium]|nr:hypothetical protein [Bacteroidia bacterium]
MFPFHFHPSAGIFVGLFPFIGWLGGAIIDSPGIKEWGLAEMTEGELGHYFPEIRERMHLCRFQDCLHKFEPACAIRKAANEGEISISRYEGYLRLLEEIKEEKEF